MPLTMRKGVSPGAQASVPSRARPTSRAMARRAGPLASSLSFRAERRRLRASWAPSVISPARSSTALALPRGPHELADLAAKRVRVDLGDVEYLWEELDYEDPDRVDYVRTVVMQVCELVQLMPRGQGVRGFKPDHCRITFRNP